MILTNFLEPKKMRDVRTIIFHQVSHGDLCYVSESEGFCFTFFIPRKQTGWGPIGKKVPSWMGPLVLLVCTIYGVTPSQYSCDFWEGIPHHILE